MAQVLEAVGKLICQRLTFAFLRMRPRPSDFLNRKCVTNRTYELGWFLLCGRIALSLLRPITTPVFSDTIVGFRACFSILG